jgi:NADP-dependent 3-hydroxy acid dehydrogenase YdfG
VSNENDRCAVVTGASSGIGKAIVEKLLALNVKIVANARNAVRLNKVANENNYKFGKNSVAVVAGDASDENVINEMFLLCKEKYHREPDIYVISAGRGLPGTMVTSDVNQWDELFQINCLGAMRQMRAAGTRMLHEIQNSNLSKKPRDIIVLGSCVGRHISPFNSVYGATKFAINSATEAMRRELCKDMIRVTLIEPGTVATEFQKNSKYDSEWFKSYTEEIGPLITGDDVANIVAFIISQPSHVHINNIVIRPTRQPYP